MQEAAIIETTSSIIDFSDPQLVVLKYKSDDTPETIESVTENMHVVLARKNIEDLLLLVVPPKNALPSIETRKFIQQELKKIPHCAVVIKSVGHKILVNFFIHIVGKNQVRMFNDESKAEEWLRAKMKQPVVEVR